MEILMVYSIPLLIANSIHHWFVVPYNILPWLTYPIDMGCTYRGRRIFGAHKTLRGFVVVTIVTSICTLLSAYIVGVTLNLPPVVFGALLGGAYMLGELPNSFLKRQYGIAEGTRGTGVTGTFFSWIDHVDSFLAAGIVLYIIEQPPLVIIGALGIAGSMVHIIFNVLLRLYGYKRVLSQ